MTCGKCGQEHLTRYGGPACIGHRSGYEDPETGERVMYPKDQQPPCTKSPMRSQDVCDSHGGKARQNKGAADRRSQQQEAERLMVTYGERVEVDPGEELLDLICWTAGHVRWLRARVQELQETAVIVGPGEDGDPHDPDHVTERKNPLVWGITKQKVGGDDAGVTYETKPNAYLALYNSETDRLAKLCADAIKIGLKQREIDLAERAAEQAFPVLKAFVAAMGMEIDDPTVVAAFKTSFRHLRAVPTAS